VKDAAGETLAGVNIVVKGRVIGTISDAKGQYNLKVNEPPPLHLYFVCWIQTQEIEIKDAATTGLDIAMAEQTLLGPGSCGISVTHRGEYPEVSGDN